MEKTAPTFHVRLRFFIERSRHSGVRLSTYMKMFLPFLLAVAAFAPLTRAEVSPISLRVQQDSNDKRDKFDDSQKKSLKIFLTNSSAADVTVKVKYYFYSKSATSKEAAVMKDGEKEATVKAHGSETVETEQVTAVFTAKHHEGKGGKGGKEVEATGEKIVGYGAKVFQGEKLAAEFYSEPSLKALTGGGN